MRTDRDNQVSHSEYLERTVRESAEKSARESLERKRKRMLSNKTIRMLDFDFMMYKPLEKLALITTIITLILPFNRVYFTSFMQFTFTLATLIYILDGVVIITLLGGLVSDIEDKTLLTVLAVQPLSVLIELLIVILFATQMKFSVKYSSYLILFIAGIINGIAVFISHKNLKITYMDLTEEEAMGILERQNRRKRK